MKRLKKPIKTILSTTFLLLTHQTAFAGSFALYTESSAAAISNYAAGIAAEAYDASTGWYNPAGLVLLESRELVLGGVGVLASSKLTGVAAYITPGLPTFAVPFSNLEGARDAVVPSFHYAHPCGDRLAFGLSVVSPFGLQTDWGEKSPLRYAGTSSKLTTVDISPEVGFRVTQNFLMGLGLDLQYARVTFNSVLGNPPFALFLDEPLTHFDSISVNKGTSFNGGIHMGFMFISKSQRSRLGINYQSAVNHIFHGTSRLTGVLADPDLENPNAFFVSNNLSSDRITLPDVFTISGYHELSDCFTILGSAVYTNWRTFSRITLNNVAAFDDVNVERAIVSNSSVVNYQNTWRFAGGVNYRFHPQWMLRAGAGFDPTPTRNRYRDIRIPDSSRWAVSVGGHYDPTPCLRLDLGYTHLFQASNAPIAHADALGDNLFVVGAKTDNNVDLIGFQVNWMIDGAGPEVAPAMMTK